MASFVDIANSAAAAIGTATRITDPNDDRTLARAIRRVWDLARRATIRDGAWNFATERHRLAELATPPPFGFAHQYQLPAGFLRLLELVNHPEYCDYRLEGDRILCHVTGPLDIRCLVDKPEPASWDDLFAQAFAYRLAWDIGTQIAGSAFDKEKVWRQYRDALTSAKRVDALENPPIDQEESDWIHARHGSYGYGARPPHHYYGWNY